MQSKETIETVSSVPESRKPKDFKSATTLEDLGMFIFFRVLSSSISMLLRLDRLFTCRDRLLGCGSCINE